MYRNESDQLLPHHFISKMWLSRTALNGLIYPQKHISMCSKKWYWLLKKGKLMNLSAQSSSERRPETSNLICECYPKNFISARWFSLTGPALGCKSFWGAPAWIKWKKNIDRRYFSQRDSKKNWGSHRTKHLKLKQINKQKQTTHVDQFRLNVQLPGITYRALPALQVISWNRVWSICVAHFISKMWLREQPSTAWHIHKNTSWISLCSKIGKASWDLKFDIWMFSSSEVLTELHLLCKSLGHHVPYGRIWYRR